MDFLKILENIELTDEQTAALDKFFGEFSEKIAKDAVAKYLEENGNEHVDLEKYILREEAEKAFELFESDCEKAFDMFEQDADRAFELFEEDAETAFNLGMEDLQKEYTENMAQALSETYSEIEERVKKDFLESKEFSTIQKLKDLIIPLLENSDNDLVKKIQALNEEKEKVLEDNKKLSKEKAISTLLKDIPQEYAETVRSFIETGRDENDVIERFNHIVEIIETKLSLSKKEDDGDKRFVRKAKPTETTEPKKPITEENTGTETKPETKPSVGYETIIRKMEKEENSIKAFNENEEAIMDKIFGKK